MHRNGCAKQRRHSSFTAQCHRENTISFHLKFTLNTNMRVEGAEQTQSIHSIQGLDIRQLSGNRQLRMVLVAVEEEEGQRERRRERDGERESVHSSTLSSPSRVGV